MRTRTETELMDMRQRYLDALVALRQSPVVNIQSFKIAYILYKTCDYMLLEYRRNHKVVGAA